MNWLKVAFDCEIQSGSPDPKSATYVTPNVSVIVRGGPMRPHGTVGMIVVVTVTMADVVTVLPAGMTTLIRVPPPMGEIRPRDTVGAPLHVSVVAVRSAPGHPAWIVAGSVGHEKATGVASGEVGAGGGVTGVEGQPVKDRSTSSTVTTTASVRMFWNLFMTIHPRAVFHRLPGVPRISQRIISRDINESSLNNG
jgi:hypothetical protein